MYQYEWHQTVLDDLADIYLAASVGERDRMAAGVAAFNARIADEPHAVGESRGDDRRLAFIPHLAIWYRVYEGTSTVRATAVQRYGR